MAMSQVCIFLSAEHTASDSSIAPRLWKISSLLSREKRSRLCNFPFVLGIMTIGSIFRPN